MSRIFKTRWLLTVNRFREIAMEKGIFNVQLVYGPMRRNSERENDANCAWFHYWTKGFIVVNPVLLGETTNNPSSLVAGKRAVGVVFVVKNPLAAD